MNDEQARGVFHATPVSLFSMIGSLQMPHKTVCQAVKVSWQL